MRIHLVSLVFMMGQSCFALDDNFFSEPIKYFPEEFSVSNTPQAPSIGANAFDAESTAYKIEVIWNQNKLRLEQNGNAAWENDFVTSTKDKNLNQMVFENNLSPDPDRETPFPWFWDDPTKVRDWVNG